MRPSGSQYEIGAGGYSAVVCEVGATLRELQLDGEAILDGFGENEICTWSRGQQLVPWPNRVRDGRWSYAGQSQQLPLNEPDRHNAIHGLTHWMPWLLVEHGKSSVTQRVVIHPQPGWPGSLEVTLRHKLSSKGLTVTVTARNLSEEDLPFGYGCHPYLRTGSSNEETIAVIPAGRYLAVDARMLPTELLALDDTPQDLRQPQALGNREFDTAFTDLARGEDQRWRVRLTGSRRRIEMWGDESFKWVQIFTANESGVALEPMTCGPDALNPGVTHEDLVWLKPDSTFEGRWGMSAKTG